MVKNYLVQAKVADFEKELSTFINKYSLEELGGDTPDFILAEYLTQQLIQFGKSIKQKDLFKSGEHIADNVLLNGK